MNRLALALLLSSCVHQAEPVPDAMASGQAAALRYTIWLLQLPAGPVLCFPIPNPASASKSTTTAPRHQRCPTTANTAPSSSKPAAVAAATTPSASMMARPWRSPQAIYDSQPSSLVRYKRRDKIRFTYAARLVRFS